MLFLLFLLFTFISCILFQLKNCSNNFHKTKVKYLLWFNWKVKCIACGRTNFFFSTIFFDLKSFMHSESRRNIYKLITLSQVCKHFISFSFSAFASLSFFSIQFTAVFCSAVLLCCMLLPLAFLMFMLLNHLCCYSMYYYYWMGYY